MAWVPYKNDSESSILFCIFSDWQGFQSVVISNLAKNKTFVRKQERQVRGVPTAFRIVHKKLWVCYANGIGVHNGGELSMLEEEKFYSLRDASNQELKGINDVTGASDNEFVVAAEKGLLNYDVKGNMF